MWCWGWKQRELVNYILLCADTPSAWGFTVYRAIHTPSDISIWMRNGFFALSIENPSRDDYKFSLSLMQRWRIYRKLNKIRQKLLKEANKREWEGFDSEEEMVMAKLVAGVLGGKSE